MSFSGALICGVSFFLTTLIPFPRVVALNFFLWKDWGMSPDWMLI